MPKRTLNPWQSYCQNPLTNGGSIRAAQCGALDVERILPAQPKAVQFVDRKDVAAMARLVRAIKIVSALVGFLGSVAGIIGLFYAHWGKLAAEAQQRPLIQIQKPVPTGPLLAERGQMEPLERIDFVAANIGNGIAVSPNIETFWIEPTIPNCWKLRHADGSPVLKVLLSPASLAPENQTRGMILMPAAPWGRIENRGGAMCIYGWTDYCDPLGIARRDLFCLHFFVDGEDHGLAIGECAPPNDIPSESGRTCP